jgi:hypothetical protein
LKEIEETGLKRTDDDEKLEIGRSIILSDNDNLTKILVLI